MWFFIWASQYYPAEEIAIEILDNDNVKVIDEYTIISSNNDSDIGIIFYPGAKVEAIAYLPILDKLSEKGYTCVIVEMPFNMAIFNTDAADDVYELLPDIKHWYIAGHSMGGAMASDYASDNPENIEGLILLGAYIYGDYPPSKSLTIYGSFNDNLEESMDYTENIIKIDGGNHAQFGNYGKQDNDPDATITSEEQQNIAVESIVEFINKRK